MKNRTRTRRDFLKSAMAAAVPLGAILTGTSGPSLTRAEMAAENLALRHQLGILLRSRRGRLPAM